VGGFPNADDRDDKVRGLCYGVKREDASRSGTSQNPQTPTPNLTPTPKTTDHTSNCVRGRFWGMHRIDLVGTSNKRFVTV
jgi:hypothetical protein